jgi:hypothetical protein
MYVSQWDPDFIWPATEEQEHDGAGNMKFQVFVKVRIYFSYSRLLMDALLLLFVLPGNW